ncbi:phosphatase PAP2 family protein [Aliidiomarina halalkaliphila]|uniref:undecaprenyl-diphosphate phosphatase n=1 Tax=Aliidiomarina halalkaliphila TaxID=2593535 RepID=A0A552X0Y4_9GAMM|nr:phosphatase PAP2 family protein [Aliidiomarina halalkaliphila]TRW48674.1 phosphatase PAP2 family protein [Aliidiomarina halalkaliphila]
MKWVNQLQRADEIAFFWLSMHLRRPSGGCLARWISRSGDGYGYVATCLLAFLLQDPIAQPLFLLLLVGFAMELPVYWLLKNTLKRARPCDRVAHFRSLIQASDRFSFPSGHTTAAFLFAGITAALMPALAPWLYAWAAAIGLSRVALGVHYPTDILAGAGLGMALAALTRWLVNGVYL